MNKECVFCHPEIEPDQQIILENASCIFLQLQSATKQGLPLQGAGVIVPKQHRETIFDVSEKEWQDTFQLLKEVKAWIDAKYQPDGYNVGWNCGSVAGQHVLHAHLHVLPRYQYEQMAGKGIRYLFKNQ
ncbi:HIT family protein [Alkalicoccobacillus porphyridii]|uniref:HIT family protein n=1 Tax=Alkalicoccobacillus porphyridii TaxID=2597270 RepID=A0A553ZX73_9BACI|nr:HIT family protein [Alkalicoccobacillus porphyridii]TSB45995.1 HIT family protein [Alkalicoccobacillus porphyridii]